MLENQSAFFFFLWGGGTLKLSHFSLRRLWLQTTQGTYHVLLMKFGSLISYARAVKATEALLFLWQMCDLFLCVPR